MATVEDTLRPNADVAFDATRWLARSTGGGADPGTGNRYSVLDDALDHTSYIESSGGSAAGVTFDFTAPTIPAGAKIEAVRLRVYALSTAGTKDGTMDLFPAGSASVHSTVLTDVPAVTTELTSAWYTSRPGGGEWTAADLAGIRASFSAQQGGLRFSEVYVEVDYNDDPVATVTAPADPFTTSSRPPVTWTYADTEGNPQEAFQVKFFTAAQYGAGGFDPETSVATYDSGVVLGSVLTFTPPSSLANATYRAYVKVRQQWTFGNFWSAWAYKQFVLNVTVPPVPSVVATNDNANGRNTIDITRGGGAWPTVPATTYYTVERSRDNGVTWATIRNGAQVVPTGITTTVYDYEASPNTANLYRASATFVSGTDTRSSAVSATDDATLGVTRWRLHDPVDPTANMLLLLGDETLKRRRTQRQGVARPFGRRNPIVQFDVRHGYEIPAAWTFVDRASRVAFDNLLDRARVLYLMSPGLDAWYVALEGVTEIDAEAMDATESIEASSVRVSFLETDAP